MGKPSLRHRLLVGLLCLSFIANGQRRYNLNYDTTGVKTLVATSVKVTGSTFLNTAAITSLKLASITKQYLYVDSLGNVVGMPIPAGTSQWVSGNSGIISYGAGNVGINTTTPTDRLQVIGTIRAGDASSSITIAGGDTYPRLLINNAGGGTIAQWINSDNGSMYFDYGGNSNSGTLNFRNKPGGGAVTAIHASRYGLVGINNVSPAANLDVTGDIKLSGVVYHTNLSSAPAAPASGCYTYSLGNHYYVICAGGVAKQLD